MKSQSLLLKRVLSEASKIRWHCMYYCCHQAMCDKSIQRENGKVENEESGEEDGEQRRELEWNRVQERERRNEIWR